ncbi:Clavesin-1 [Araneus ventricosus]|uniref:Clavesin-1 n=1 Tax=Araneus ventricosus TaxID=182803 RepID=A0A4Y2IDD2_ARAVE|nr:Clavesin-1 [Araneus ventricosus]
MNHSLADFLPFDATSIDNPSVIANKREINESEESRTRCLEILRRESENLEGIEPCLDESFLLRFLRVSKFDTSKALERLKKYYKQSDVFLDAFRNCTLPLQKAQNLNHFWTTPYRLKNNSLLLIAINRKVNYRKVTFAERFYTEIIGVNEILENQLNQICGFTFILDFDGFDIFDLTEFTPGWLRLYLDSMLNVFPCRIRDVHIVNAPSLFSVVYTIVYPFLSKKIRDRIFFHSKRDDWKSLHNSISADILPEQYNGKVKQEDLINCSQNKEEMDKKFRDIFLFGYSETKQRRQSMKVLC